MQHQSAKPGRRDSRSNGDPYRSPQTSASKPLAPAATGGGAAPPERRWLAPLAAVALALLTTAAYWNSFAGVMIFDDLIWIEQNQSIHDLSQLGEVLRPTRMAALGGRPLVSLSLALNYAAGGLDVWGYHLFNLSIHILAAWILFGLVRRTLLLPGPRERFGSAATPLAFCVAAIWALHPLQTQAVTYIIQRTESLVGLFYLLVLYCLVRGATAARRSIAWYAAGVLSCALGMATKEVMVTAPLVALLYDRTFLGGSFRAALAARWKLYLAFVATWGIVAWGLWETQGHGGTAGFNVEGFTPLSYLLTQSGVILHYLQLTFYPAGQCIDYGWPAAQSFGQIVPQGLAILALLGLTIWALVKRPWLGFLGASFFVILAPTSSFVPIRDAAFEHRMYLPLAAIAALVVIGGWALCCRLLPETSESGAGFRWMTAVATPCVMLAVLGCATFERNKVYGSQISAWADVEANSPNNPRAHDWLGLLNKENPKEQIAQYRQALKLDRRLTKRNAAIYNSLGLALEKVGQPEEALKEYKLALECDPRRAETHTNLGMLYARRGQNAAALDEFHAALALDPKLTEARKRLAMVLGMLERYDEAIQVCRDLIHDEPRNGQAESELAVLLARRGRGDDEEAMSHYEHAVRLEPNNAECRFNLACALTMRKRVGEAIDQLKQALSINPGYAAAQEMLRQLELYPSGAPSSR